MTTTGEAVKYTTLFIEKRDKIATIHLNRPERLNAISDTMRDEIVAACDDLAVDSSISVVILKGEGRAFSSGADVKNAGVVDSGSELHPGDTAADWLRAQREQLFLWKVWDLPKPVIAQVHGYALGMGSLLMTMCDLVVIAEDARVGNEMGFRNSLAAGIDFDSLAHKSTEGLEMENRVASDGFINVGREMYTAYPARHGRA